ncbi:streptomycin phosphotransferase [Gammaproteobacteria bacterium]|nr:streptomycin phosphotransferase [Gammaproteobacteria bacterium]
MIMSLFEKKIIDIYGTQGKDWIASLPDIILSLAQKYNLSDLQPVSNMSFNYVAKGYKSNKAIVLKLGLDHEAYAREAECLRSFRGHSVPEVIASDIGMLLIEQAVPGNTLKEYFPNNDIKAVNIISKIINNLHQAKMSKNNNFRKLKDVLKVLDTDLFIPNNILLKARALRDQLLITSNKEVLLHGDLHHDNILKNATGWMAIDPKGYVGDPCFEVCPFISNPIPELLDTDNPMDIIDNRSKLFAKNLNVTEQRIREWHFVQVVLGWAWCLEDGIAPDYFVRLVDLIE